MSLSGREQQALDTIKDRLSVSDPKLVALLAIFTRLAAGEPMPAREKIRAGSRQAARLSRRPRRLAGATSPGARSGCANAWASLRSGC